MSKLQGRSESGQATIEFALTMMMLMGFVLFYTQLSLVFAWGNYVHYATFMSARAYLAGGPNQDDQTERAKNYLLSMVKRSAAVAGADKFPAIAKGTGGGEPAGVKIGPGDSFNYGDRDFSWQEGVRYTFRSKVMVIPLGRAAGGRNSTANSVTLTSESWLLREPTFEDCIGALQEAGSVYFDNGC